MTIRPDVIKRTLDRHVSWENGGTWRHVAGDFDGQGMSLGSIQFAAGEAGGYNLQRVLRAFIANHFDVFLAIFGEYAGEVMAALDTVEGFHQWAVSKNQNDEIINPYHGMFESLANHDVWKQAEIPFIQEFIDQAEYILQWFTDNSSGESIMTDRGFDLAFDTACQQWNPSFYRIGETGYFAKLEAIAWAARDRAGDKWKDDTYSRKMAIARQDGGMVHESWYRGTYDDLPMYEEDYDIATKDPYQPGGGNVANVFTGEPELTEVREKPLQDPAQEKFDYEMESIAYMKERGAFPERIDYADRVSPVTWGELAAVIRKYGSYLYQQYLKKI